MINLLKNFFEREDNNKSNDDSYHLKLLCGLMIEAANSDGQVDNIEIEKIELSLIDTFKEDPVKIKVYLKEAIINKNNDKSLHNYTSKLNKEFPYEKKLMLVEILWDIILSDGEIHDYEASLIRRLCGLLYINDIDSGNAKKRALSKIKDRK